MGNGEVLKYQGSSESAGKTHSQGRKTVATHIADDTIAIVPAVIPFWIIPQVVLIRVVSLQSWCLCVNSQQVAGDQHHHTATDDYGVNDGGRVTNQAVI